MRFIVHMCTWNNIFIWPLLLMCLVVNKQLCSTYHARIQKKISMVGVCVGCGCIHVCNFVCRGEGRGFEVFFR